VIPLNIRLKALDKNKGVNYWKVLDFKNEALVRVLEINLEKGKYKKLNTVRQTQIYKQWIWK
jgi:hypothetical protein